MITNSLSTPWSSFDAPKKEIINEASVYNNKGNLRTVTNTDDQKRALDLIMGSLNKTFGKGTVYSLADQAFEVCPTISTGSLGIDIATGIGGIPQGRIIEVYGPESSGKTTLCLQIIAEAQARSGVAAFIDAEHALDVKYARQLGVNTDDLIFSQPDYGEQALEIVDGLVRSGTTDVIVIDSVAALVPKKELEGDMGASLPGLQARLMSQAMRKLTSIAKKTNTTIIFINQIRSKIGVMFGSPETTTGGNALKFYASMRLDIRRIGSVKDNQGNFLANQTRVKIVKNKLAPPFKQAEFTIVFGEGIDYVAEVIDQAVAHNIIKKSGSWYSHKDTRLGQGVSNVKAILAAAPELMKEIEDQVLFLVQPQPTIQGILEDNDQKEKSS